MSQSQVESVCQFEQAKEALAAAGLRNAKELRVLMEKMEQEEAAAKAAKEKAEKAKKAAAKAAAAREAAKAAERQIVVKRVTLDPGHEDLPATQERVRAALMTNHIKYATEISSAAIRLFYWWKLKVMPPSTRCATNAEVLELCYELLAMPFVHVVRKANHCKNHGSCGDLAAFGFMATTPFANIRDKTLQPFFNELDTAVYGAKHNQQDFHVHPAIKWYAINCPPVSHAGRQIITRCEMLARLVQAWNCYLTGDDAVPQEEPWSIANPRFPTLQRVNSQGKVAAVWQVSARQLENVATDAAECK